MANSPQARKRARQADRRNTRNAASRSRLRTAIKAVTHAVEGGDKTAAQIAYRTAVRIIDLAYGKGLIHRNKAARHKNRLNNVLRTMT